MKFFKYAAAAVFATSSLARPLETSKAIEKRGLTDPIILNFALTLEHLENTFYKYVIATFSYDDFIAAGYSDFFYYNLLYLAHDEEQHVILLEGALKEAGVTPVAACTYDFGLTDVYSAVTLASVLEGIGTAAYLGAAPYITNPEYLTVAGSILVTESIHQSLIRYNAGEVSAANPYGSYLGVNEVYTLAAPLFVSCPASNPALPLTAFPTLVAASGPVTGIGATWTFTTTAALPSEVWVTFVNGLVTESIPGTVDGTAVSAVIPSDLGGQTYVVLTNTKTTMLADSQVIAGPAVIEVYPAPPTFDPSIL